MRMFAHQRSIFESTKDREYFGLLWEMRVGKNLPIIATALHNYYLGRINAVVIVAPSGVHINWSRVVIPMEWPEDFAALFPFTQATLPQHIIEWDGGKAKQKGWQAKALAALTTKGNLVWVCMNVEALSTDSGYDFLELVLKHRKAMLACDESDTLKSPKAERTKVALKLAPNFALRRILTGTSAPQGPFDLWSQLGILSPTIIGIRLYSVFKQRYGIFRKVKLPPVRLSDGKLRFRPPFEQLVAYRDTEQLAALYKPHTSRLTQADVYADLPPTTPDIRYFVLSDAQRAAYNKLRKELLLELDNGATITATNALTMTLRLQQISRGFLTDQDGTTHHIHGPNPAVEATLGAIRMIEGKVIVWAAATEDINMLLAAMADEGVGAVRYDGKVDKDNRYINLQAFLHNPQVKVMVGTPATGGVGLDVSVASTTIFHSHTYKLRERLQAIARMQGPNQAAKGMLLLDVVGADTHDLKCLKRLAEKGDMLDSLMGDNNRVGYESPSTVLRDLLSEEA